MSKFTSEEKHAAVQRYLYENISYRTLADEIGVDNSTLRYWVKLHEYHGDKAFAFPYTNYSRAFKLEVIQFIVKNDYSVREASARFHIPDFSMVRRWKKKWELGGGDALEPSGKGHNPMSSDKKKNTNSKPSDEDSIQAMQEELEYLRAENAYLKKLKALVQKKEASQTKKKRK